MNDPSQITQINTISFEGGLSDVLREAAKFVDENFEYDPPTFSLDLQMDGEFPHWYLNIYFSGGNGYN